MKILQFPAYITLDENKEFSRSTSGYGYMTFDIATSIAKLGIEVDLLTQSNITKGLIKNKVNILKRTWLDILFNIKFTHLLSGIKTAIIDRVSFKKLPNIIFYYVGMGYFERILKREKYDLVHIHGIGHYTLPIIETCKRHGVKYLVTLHGLNSFSDSINISKREQFLEKIFLKEAHLHSIPVSVVSSGIRTTISQYLKTKNSTNFLVISNGCKLSSDEKLSFNIKIKHKVQKNSQIMLCVGNIGNNKNQMQLVRAFSLLPKECQMRLTILFLGKDTTQGQFEQLIQHLELDRFLKYCGNIRKDKLFAYYSQSDFCALVSISEGFGLSLIEGFTYGLPCLTFKDLDAVTDIYNENCMVLLSDRSDESIAKGLQKMLSSVWDHGSIIEHGKKFSLDNMANEYDKYYKKILQT